MILVERVLCARNFPISCEFRAPAGWCATSQLRLGDKVSLAVCFAAFDSLCFHWRTDSVLCQSMRWPENTVNFYLISSECERRYRIISMAYFLFVSHIGHFVRARAHATEPKRNSRKQHMASIDSNSSWTKTATEKKSTRYRMQNEILFDKAVLRWDLSPNHPKYRAYLHVAPGEAESEHGNSCEICCFPPNGNICLWTNQDNWKTIMRIFFVFARCLNVWALGVNIWREHIGRMAIRVCGLSVSLIVLLCHFVFVGIILIFNCYTASAYTNAFAHMQISRLHRCWMCTNVGGDGKHSIQIIFLFSEQTKHKQPKMDRTWY